jgi:hypothetical protein
VIRMKSNLVKVSALIAGLSIATATVSVTKVAEALPQDSKLQFVQDTQSDTQPEVIKEQTGKLKIVNNTPFMAIVQLYQSNTDQPYRYAYIPPCYERSFLNTYSNLWQVSFNNQRRKAINDVSDKTGNTFVVRTSNLNQDTNRTCLYKLTAKPVFSLSHKEFVNGITKAWREIVKSPIPDMSKLPVLARETEKLDLRFWNSFPIEVQKLGHSKLQEFKEALLSIPPNRDGLDKFNELLQKNGSESIGDKQYQEMYELANISNSQHQTKVAMLEKNTFFNGKPIQPGEDGIGLTQASAKEASSFASAIYKKDVFRVSSIIDFSKWYASYRYQSKPESGAYNVALVSN